MDTGGSHEPPNATRGRHGVPALSPSENPAARPARAWKQLLVVVLAFSPETAVPAQSLGGGVPQGQPTSEVLELTLAGAIELGLHRNLGLLLSQEGVATASGARAVARAGLLPRLRARVSDDYQKVNLEAFGFSGFPGVPTLIGPFNVLDARAYVSQTVLDLDALASARAADRTLDAREHDLASTRDNVVLACANLYLQVLASESRTEAVRAQLETAEALYEVARSRKEAGLSPGIDVLRAEVQVQTERQRVIVADNDTDKRKLALARAIGLPVGQRFRLVDEMPSAPAALPGLEEAIAMAYERREDLKAAEARVDVAEEEERAARGEGLPSIGVAGDFGAIGNTIGGSRGTFTLSAGVTIPLFEGGRIRGKVAEARSTLRKQQALLEDLRAGIHYEVQAIYGDVEAAAQRVLVAESALSLARQTLEQAEDRFAAGVAGNIDVVQAQELLARAAEDRIESLLAASTARAALARALGTAERDYLDVLRGTNR